MRTLWPFFSVKLSIEVLFCLALGMVLPVEGAPSGRPAEEAVSPVGVKAAQLELCARGKAMVPIVIAPEASPLIRKLALELAEGLSKMTGASFRIVEGLQPSGIVLGTLEQWPGAFPKDVTDLEEIYTRDDYLIRTTPTTLYLIGRTPTATQHALWDFFYQLGFRQFFPGPLWETWPEKTANLKVSINRFERPDFYFRELTSLDWPENREAFLQWKVRNRLNSGFKLKTGHAYHAIVSRNRAFFDQHPEALTKGEKFDPTYPGLEKILVGDALKELEKNPDSISMDPSDHGGWRADLPMGSPSNQVVGMANDVAKGIAGRFPESRIGIYAYNEHSPPPDVEVHPNLIVSIATAFIKGGFSVDELMEGWKAKGATIGIRDYMSVWLWGKDQPGRSRAADLDYLFRTIPHFHQKGARFWRAETTPSWGANGLGHYIVARLLWDVSQAGHRQALLSDFYQRSFGPAASDMQRYFEECLLAQAKAPLSQDLVGRMYRHLHAALQQPTTEVEKERIGNFILYTRYVELTLLVKSGNKEQRRQTLRDMGSFAYRARLTGMISSRWILRDFSQPNDVIEPISALAPREEHPFKQEDEPISLEELEQLVTEGMDRYPLLDFAPRFYSSELVPSPGEASQSVDPSPVVLVGHSRLYLYAKEENTKLSFDVKVISKHGNRGAARLALFSPDDDEGASPLATAQAPADHRLHTLYLHCPEPGLYRLEVDAPGNTEFGWPEGQFVALPQESVQFGKSILHDFFFYVPADAEVVAGYSSDRSGTIFNSQGERVHTFSRSGAPGHFSIPVNEDDRGSWWMMKGVKGSKLLMTVPPFLVRSPGEGLIPRESRSSL